MAPIPLMKSAASGGLELESQTLKTVQDKLKQEKCTHVCIISVMGAWRTGKSFLLDLLMRYLRTRAEKEAKMPGAPKLSGPPEPGNEEPWAFTAKSQGQAAEKAKQQRSVAEWIYSGGDKMNEGGGIDGGDSRGFGWNGGDERVTTGIWIFSEPFVILDKNNRRIGVLLMDTQGAWDAQMTKEQSASIFGMTALLSSKLIYNISQRIDADKLANLDYFTSFAEKACGVVDSSEKKPFGHLEFLIRDWPYYKAKFTLEECENQMKDHLGKFLSDEGVADKEAAQRLYKCFTSIRCSGLRHPGEWVPEPEYDGNLECIDKDFFYLLNSFTDQFFGDDSFPKPSAPLGVELTTQAFVKTVENFAKAFENCQDMTLNLRDALVKIEAAKDEDLMVKNFRSFVENAFPDHSVLDPEQLKSQMDAKKEEIKKAFETKLKPWKLLPEQEKSLVDDLVAKMDQVSTARLNSNNAEVENATLKVVGAPVVGFGVYFAATHAWLIAMGASVGGWLSMKRHATANQTEMCDPAVFSGIAADAKTFCTNRFRDVQAMGVAVQRLEINKVRDAAMAGGLRLQGQVQAASNNNNEAASQPLALQAPPPR